MIRVVVVDDQALVRGGFQVLIDSAPDMEVVGEAADGARAVELVAATRPDVVLMDVRMPVMDGLAATREILRRVDGVRVLVLTTFDLDSYVYDAGGRQRLPAHGRPPGRAARRGPGDRRRRGAARPARHPAAAGGVRGPPRPRPAATADARRAHRAGAGGAHPDRAGLLNAEITERLVVSAATTKTHISHLLAKLDARDRAQLVVIAYTSGFMVRTTG